MQDIGFNGAGVFRPRKCRKPTTTRADLQKLQWGRGLSTPEVLGRLYGMNILRTLQWGRGLSTPEVTL